MNHTQKFAAVSVALSISTLLLVGCDTPPEPTQTPIPITIMAASPTVAPIVPTVANQDTSNVGVDGFTPAAGILSSANPNATITPTPAPTEVSIRLVFVANDGVTLVGSFYGAPSRPAPTVLLLHMNGSNKESWRSFAALLQGTGYNALAIDLRGHGESGGTPDWTKAPSDVVMILGKMSELPGVDTGRISVVGASIGANLGLVACAQSKLCKSVVMLSPALNFGGVETSNAIVDYGTDPIFIAASRSDKPSGTDAPTLDQSAKGDHTLQLFDGTVHGTTLLTTQPSLSSQIIQWLKAH